MTQTFLDTLTAEGYAWKLVERRFSRRLADIGAFRVRKLLSAISLMWRLTVAVLAFRPSACVVFATNREFSFLVDFGVCAIMRIFGINTALYIHTVGYTRLARKGKAWEFLVDRTFAWSTAIICLSPTLVGDTRPWSVSVPVYCIPNTVRLPSDDASEIVRNAILFFSNLLPEKGLDTFLEIARALRPRLPTVRFIVAGATAEAASRSPTGGLRAYSHTDGVEFIGALTPKLKVGMWDQCIALAFPSRYRFEAQPLVVLEALAAGVPVVSFDIGGLRDVIRDGVNGYLIQQGDVAEMGAKLRRLAELPQLRAALSAASRADFQVRFSNEAYRDAWRDVLARVVLPRGVHS